MTATWDHNENSSGQVRSGPSRSHAVSTGLHKHKVQNKVQKGNGRRFAQWPFDAKYFRIRGADERT